MTAADNERIKTADVERDPRWARNTLMDLFFPTKGEDEYDFFNRFQDRETRTFPYTD